VKSWLALCHLFQNHVEDMELELNAPEACFAADEPGGSFHRRAW
jgi:hypothetical protein